jgi:hypothetical protein
VTEGDWSEAAEKGGVLGFIPVGRKLVRDAHIYDVVFEGESYRRLEPGSKSLKRKLKLGLIEKPRPSFVGRERHQRRPIVEIWESMKRGART